MTWMRCGDCGQTIDKCQCADIDARLKAGVDAGPYVMVKWCRLCDRHYARCGCIAPDFYVRSNGKEVEVPKEGFTDITGGRQVPDLKRP